MKFIDGFVLAVPESNKEMYREEAVKMAAIFKNFGALSVIETWGVDVPEGDLTSFPMAVKCEPGEVVVFSFVTWPSKAVRDEAMPKIIESPGMGMAAIAHIFDTKRMIYGGFEMFVEL